jgi:homoserine kinase
MEMTNFATTELLDTKTEVRVFAPASVANVACGFDVLGFALEKPGDEIVVRFSDAFHGLKITAITGGKLPMIAEKNTAGFAALKLLEHLGESDLGIEMEIHKKMPFGSGLGSSAASAAGAVVAVNGLLGNPLTKFELLPFAVQGESIASGAFHADNIAPSLLGGFTLVRDTLSNDIHSIPVPAGMYATVVYPKVEVLTKEARAILKAEVPLKNAVKQTANIAAFVLGMVNSDFGLIRRSLQDVIIEPQRAQLIPHFFEVKNAAYTEGVLGCSISGSGPSIFALSQDLETAKNAGQAMRQIFDKNGIEAELFISPINTKGAAAI